MFAVSPSCLTLSCRRSLVRSFCDAAPAYPPDLTDLPRVILPSFFFSLFNVTIGRAVINNVADPHFSWAHFLLGAKQAIFVVSRRLSEGGFGDLDGLVKAQSVAEIQRNIAPWRVDQRRNILIEEESLLFSAPYKTYLTNENGMNQVNVNVLVQYVPGGVTESMSSLSKFRDNAYIANYEFFRNYKKREPVGGWKIGRLNHFSHKDQFSRWI